jgi:transposase-like protein
MKELKVRLMERMLVAELTAHLGYEAGAEPPPEQTNRRNGVTTKRVKGSDGEVPLSVPRDREGSFEPVLVKKGQTRIDGVDDQSEPASAPLMVWMAPAPGIAMCHIGCCHTNL